MSILTPARYPATLRYLHWVMAALVLAAYLFVEQRGLFARGSPARAAMMQAHFWAGLTVGVLVVWRIVLRARITAPPITPMLPPWQSWPSRLVHLALYAFLLAMPLLGLATAWTDGKAVQLPFAGIALPALLHVDRDLAHRLEDLHGAIGEAFYWVIGLHVLAALYHHVVRDDDTLRRML